MPSRIKISEHRYDFDTDLCVYGDCVTYFEWDLGMSDDEVLAGVETALRKYFGKRGERVVQDNVTCVKRGFSEMKQIPREVIADAAVPA